MRLCIGTVQFGMDYGVAHTKALELRDAVDCLDYAVQNGVSAIDTSPAYGYAESIVGEFIKKKTVARDALFISDKLYPELRDDLTPKARAGEISRRVETSLKTLNTDYFDAYMYHTSTYAFRPELLEALFEIKRQGRARSVGVSVYEPLEALACRESDFVDFMQAPYSAFDRRMKNAGAFDSRGKMTIHARSAFVQGLLFMKEDELPPYLAGAAPFIKRYSELCRDYRVSEAALAMGYVKREEAISAIVFGAIDREQIRNNINDFAAELPDSLIEIVEREFRGMDEELYVPTRWKKQI